MALFLQHGEETAEVQPGLSLPPQMDPVIYCTVGSFLDEADENFFYFSFFFFPNVTRKPMSCQGRFFFPRLLFLVIYVAVGSQFVRATNRFITSSDNLNL